MRAVSSYGEARRVAVEELLSMLKMQRFGSILCVGLAMVTLAVTQFGCDEGLNATSTGTLQDPGAFSFPKVAPGASAESRVTLVNFRPAPCCSKTSLSLQTGAMVRLPRRYYGEAMDGAPNPGIIDGQPSEEFQRVIQIDGGQALTFVLTYTRMNTEIPSGSLLMSTNDVNYNRLQIPILGQAASAELVVVPDYVDFGCVAVGDSARIDVQISNVGVEAATISALDVLGSASFGLEPDGQDPVQNRQATLQDPDGDGQPGLAPSGTFVLVIIYQAPFERADRGELSISERCCESRRSD